MGMQVGMNGGDQRKRPGEPRQPTLLRAAEEPDCGDKEAVAGLGGPPEQFGDDPSPRPRGASARRTTLQMAMREFCSLFELARTSPLR